MGTIGITSDLVQRLIARQFPQWSRLEVRPVDESGHDNRTFRLGPELAVRLPSHERYASAVEKEQKWLPVFQPHLTLPITVPVAKGEPDEEYPLPWSVNRWLAGEPVSRAAIRDKIEFAEDLAAFLLELEAIDATDGVPAGEQNFHRGGDLAVYEDDARSVLARPGAPFDAALLTEVWERALAAPFSGQPVWLHGDVAVGNLLASGGRLSGVIDFGTMGVGDRSSDLVMAWNFFDAPSRAVFLGRMAADEGVIDRARGWALWKALITYEWHEKGSELSEWGRRVIDEIAAEHRGRRS
ncbi:aminoglycoside phosphotransferase family protein [Paenibacillus pasadenensis]|uniref:Aminoglycoside phosphotransferase n=1 Tax=Paenibacillus pasadenensis TaxID=217090 RepID=A0A2N5N9V9_9BACL|nr:aminoglycoside phosphotransferase family protein [Paenibacillus pasadenensis]PLT47136.1 Aminoglycoside phosphotransferase [Paenibacillus pasadenensis]